MGNVHGRLNAWKISEVARAQHPPNTLTNGGHLWVNAREQDRESWVAVSGLPARLPHPRGLPTTFPLPGGEHYRRGECSQGLGGEGSGLASPRLLLWKLVDRQVKKPAGRDLWSTSFQKQPWRPWGEAE